MPVGKGKLPLRFTSILLLIVTLLAAFALRTGGTRDYYEMADSLDEVVAVVDGEDITVRDVAFYIAYEEQRIEQDAYVYNPSDTGEYWRMYTNGTFVRAEGKRAVIQMAIHDRIFYRMALDAEIALNEEEEGYLANSQYDFWSDLEDWQREALAVGQETINDTMRKMALAEKYQNIYALQSDVTYEEYSFSGAEYQNLLDNHVYEIITENWSRVHFGSITVNH